MLVKFGEDRRRFPHSSMVQTLAGTAPVTNQSGKVHLVHFRRSCDKEFRYFSQQLARSSRQQSRWLRLTLQARQRATRSVALIGL
ncbi:transposase [Chloroflexi bacterium TSY]|nr:transposase [Chloroflexi bacterium TSY]